MSVNAFYSAYGNTQNALGDPRGDARKREQEDMLNAIKRREMQMKEYEFSQTQAEAQRAERERQLLAAREASRAGFIRETMFPNRTPTQSRGPISSDVQSQLSERPSMAMPMGNSAPMMGGAPIEQAPQGQAFIDPATGREGATYTASSARRGPMPTEEELLDFEIQDAEARGDNNFLNDRINARRKLMTDQEKKGREQIALVSGALFNLPDADLPSAVMQTLRDLNIDLEATKLDDYINDVPKLRRALRVQIALGSPEKAAEEAVKTQGTFEQYRAPEIRDTGGAFTAIGTMPGNAGARVGTPIRKTVDPTTAATNATRERIARISASTTMSEGEKNRAIKQEELKLKRRMTELGLPQGAPLEAGPDQQSSGIIWDDEE